MANPNSSYPTGIDDQTRVAKVDPSDREESPTYLKIAPTGELEVAGSVTAVIPNPLPVTIANGADVAEGSTTDAAVVSDANGTISGKLRGLVKIFADVWDSVLHRLKVSVPDGVAVTSSTLPTGAATEATLAEIGADIDTIEANTDVALSTRNAEATQLLVKANLITLNSLVPSAYDYIALSYTGVDLTTVTWKVGGSGGTTVAIVALSYTANVLQTVTRTFP